MQALLTTPEHDHEASDDRESLEWVGMTPISFELVWVEGAQQAGENCRRN
jgi:hypothetical protein